MCDAKFRGRLPNSVVAAAGSRAVTIMGTTKLGKQKVKILRDKDNIFVAGRPGF